MIPHPSLAVPAAALLALAAPLAQAGSPVIGDSKSTEQLIGFPFLKGNKEIQSITGAYFFFSPGSNPRHPAIDYSRSSYRFGLMLYDVCGGGFLRGNAELLVEASGGSVFQGPGNYLFGGALLLRYNFVQPESKWVPYIQIGGGGVYNDVYKEQSQRLIGRNWEFDLQASLGLRYFLSEKWAVTVEGSYRHISNADTADRNLGLNSLGGGIGLNYFF